MSAIRAVASYQLRKNLRSRGFLLSLLTLPGIVLLSIGLGIIIETLNREDVILGIVDPGRVVKIHEVIGVEEPPALAFFENEQAAQTALDDDEIQAFYSLPGDYPTNRVVILVYYKSPNWEIQEFFGDLLRTNLLAGLPDDLVARVIDQPEITIHAMETGRIFPNSTPSLGLLVPAFAVLIYMFSIFPIAELLAGTLGDEKTNRTIEMIMTSIRTNELIIGKLSAAAILLLMQIAVWVILIIGLVWLGRFTLNEAWLWDVRIVWRDLGQIILLAISGLIFYGSVLVFAGAMFSQEEDVRQAASLVILPLFLPVYILPVIIEDSGSLMAQIFSLVPITSVQTMGIQLMFAPLPGWKVLLATGLNLGGAALFSWLAVRVFRSGMLRYGKRLRLKDLFKRQAKQGGTGVP